MGLGLTTVEEDIPATLELPYRELLEENELAYLSNMSNSVSYNRRDVIFLQNTRTSHIMYLKKGLIKIYKGSRSKKTIVLKLVSPGFYIGLLSLFGSDIHQYSAAAVESSEIIFVDIHAFRSVLTKNGKYALKLLERASNDGLFIFNRLMAQTHKQLPGRVADVILYFAETVYKSNTFTFPLTRKELAELAGTTKESFIRTLMEFKNDKIIKLEGSHVEIESMKIVKTLSELG